MNPGTLDSVICIGHFGLEYIKTGNKKPELVIGGSGYRFSLFLSLFKPLKVFSLLGARKHWEKIIKKLSANGINISALKFTSKEITFYIKNDKNLKLLDLKVVGDHTVDEWLALKSQITVNHKTLLHICPLNFQVQRELAKNFKNKGASISLQIHFTEINEKTKILYLDTLKYVDYLFLNKTEASQFCSKKNLVNIGRFLSQKTNAFIFITNEDKNVMVFKNGNIILKSKPIVIKDPTNLVGAGDAFAAGVIGGIVTTKDLRRSLLLGMLTARLCIQCRSLDQIINFINISK